MASSFNLCRAVLLRELPLCHRCLQRARGRVGARKLPSSQLIRTAVARLCSTVVNEQAASPSDVHAVEEEVPGVQLEPTAEEIENTEPWLVKEIHAFYRGRRRLAEMMGRDPETFTDKDVEEAIQYLLPTRLSARDARPFLKHPSHVFAKRKASAFDSAGRPLEAAFYTGSPAYHNTIYEIYCQYRLLEVAMEDRIREGEGQLREEVKAVPAQWVKMESLSNIIAEEISEKQYKDLISRLTHLAAHPLSSMAKEFLDRFCRPLFSYRSHAKVAQLGEEGRARAVGKRKTSTAYVTLQPGSGEVRVNGHGLLQYFPRVEDRQQVLFPLMVTGQMGWYSVQAVVKGGGTTGQAGAVRLGISRALLAFPGNNGDLLERAGLLVRDPRMVERKKPGQKKARKKFAWVKR